MEKEINGKQQKINDEDYEIIKVIESGSPYDAEKWYRQNYECDWEEARAAIKEIRRKYKITYGEKYIPDADEISEKLEEFRETVTKESAAQARVLSWYVATSGIRQERAVDKLIDAGVDFNWIDRLVYKRGCGGALLVILAIVVSILFVLFLLFS